jgi:hypothetical protein
VHRARIAVELGRHRERHAAPGAQVGDLLLGQGLDGPLLQAGVLGVGVARVAVAVTGMRVLGTGREADRKAGDDR